jgi:isoamylase
MILMGDEARRTQLGNNNAYCQDNALSWLDWTLVERHRDLQRFVEGLIALRQRRELSAGEQGLTLNQILAQARIEWHGVRLGQPDWGDDSHSLACTLWSLSGRLAVHLMVSAYWEPLRFELPPVPGGPGATWNRLIDTALDAPEDIANPGDAWPIAADSYALRPRSLVLLLAHVG